MARWNLFHQLYPLEFKIKHVEPIKKVPSIIKSEVFMGPMSPNPADTVSNTVLSHKHVISRDQQQLYWVDDIKSNYEVKIEQVMIMLSTSFKH